MRDPEDNLENSSSLSESMENQTKKGLSIFTRIIILCSVVFSSVLLAQNTTQPQGKKTVWAKIKPTAQKLLKYDSVESLYEERIEIRLGNDETGKSGFIDQNGQEIISPKYDSVSVFSEGLAAVELNKKWGFIDKTGKQVLSLKYDFAGIFHDGLAPVELNGKSGFIDKTGKIIIPLQYDFAYPFSEGLALVRSGESYNFIDKTGKELIALKYDDVSYFSEGLALFKVFDSKLDDSRYGFIDKTGREVIPAQYAYAGRFTEGLAPIVSAEGLGRVTSNNYKKAKWGFIDKTGQVLIPTKYEDTGSFFNGWAWVKLNNKFGAIDKNGKEIIPIKYDRIWCHAFQQEGFIGVVFNGKKGFVDIEGNEYFNF